MHPLSWAGLPSPSPPTSSPAQVGLLPPFFSSFTLSTMAPFHLTSFALSLLLVFRTNASYARWKEARASWGLVVARIRWALVCQRRGSAWSWGVGGGGLVAGVLVPSAIPTAGVPATPRTYKCELLPSPPGPLLGT